MADYKVTVAQLTSVANAIRAKFGDTATLEFPSDFTDKILNGTVASGGSEITPQDPTAEYKVTDTEMTAIANAIRTRGGTALQLEFPADFVSAIGDISGGGSVEIVPWSTGTDEQIVAMLQAAHNGDIDLQTDGGWSVGDERTISISSFVDGTGVTHAQQDQVIVISSFDDYMNCGCVMQFDFKQCLATTIKMNATSVNTGGYRGSLMYTDTLPALVNALPSWLKNNLIEFSCLAYTGNTSTSQIETVTGNKLALRSYKEIYQYADTVDGTYFSYYGVSDRKKKMRGGSRAEWWLRTPYTNDTSFRAVSTNGGNETMSAGVADSLSPFGCL